jgi:aminoglycoside phosphotransferase (APT) family kinase protein
MRRIWEDALAAAPYDGDGCWLHGDLLSGNLLCIDRRLSAVIDFGALGVGDPSPDLTPAWTLFGGDARNTYRREVDCDDAEWRRGRGWALAPALGGLGYYWETFPLYRDLAERTIAAVSAEFLAG